MRLILLLLIVTIAVACGSKSPTGPTAPPPPSSFSQMDLVVGTGTEATTGRPLTVHYTGWIYDASKPDSKGTQFETSVGRTPFAFTLGGNVIPGWNQGIVGMRVGGQRRLIIPPGLAYGSTGSGPIPPNAGLVFDVELVSVS